MHTRLAFRLSMWILLLLGIVTKNTLNNDNTDKYNFNT